MRAAVALTEDATDTAAGPAIETSQASSRDFYQRYSWCLDPFLPLGDLLVRLCEELDGRSRPAPEWQKRESAVNVYLFACAIACTIDDYLDEKTVDLSPIAKIARSPILKQACAAAERILNLPAAFRRRSKAAAWRERWTGCVDAACLELLHGETGGFDRAALPLLDKATASIGAGLLRRRMRIPEGFRCQDLAHQDVVALANQYLADAAPDRAKPLLVIGPRTAGAYFAPLAAASLRVTANLSATWITVRPKNGLSSAERSAIRSVVRRGGSFLVIDDHPNTGVTLRLLLGMLERLGGKPARIAAAVPGHPANPGWTLPEAESRGIRMVVLAPENRYKVKLLASGWIAGVLGQPVGESLETREVNRKFESAAGDGFEVRLKRLVDVPGSGRVLAKSVGWGWLGYHAFLAGERLEGFVPSSLAQREGILFSEWIEGEPVLNATSVTALGFYIARRSATLALKREPRFGHPELGWCGWNDLTATLRKVYGPYLGRFKQPAILRALRSLQPPKPVLLDGQMRPGDWIRRNGRLYKTDFEHHNFGGAELDLTDPAWDLASASFEFGMNEGEEADLLDAYTMESRDFAVDQRLTLYKILCAMTVMRASTYWIGKKPGDARHKRWAERYLAARDFAAFQMTREMGRELARRKSVWTEKLLFLDLDGVLDWNQLGFPHTTPDGVEALRILKEGGVSCVLNTARSLEHVRQYARSFGLAGGVAELGSVFWDAVAGRETSLVDAASLAAMDRVREAVARTEGVAIDPQHRHSIRAFRFDGEKTVRLRDTDLALADLTGLAVIHSGADTHVIAKGAGKATGVAAVRILVNRRVGFVAAIGDSDQDLDMLRAADVAFAPANASRGIREMAAAGRCRMMKRPLQAGLLEAARILAPGVPPLATKTAPAFLNALLAVAQRSGLERMTSVLRWNRL